MKKTAYDKFTLYTFYSLKSNISSAKEILRVGVSRLGCASTAALQCIGQAFLCTCGKQNRVSLL